MKKYNISVNGKLYEVEVQEVGGSAPASAPVTPTPAPKTKAATVAKTPTPAAPKAAPTVSDGQSTISAPMPGTILDIKVNTGDAVESGQVLMILEAMKMENEIMAPAAGKVVSVSVTKGASVASGDVLIVLE